MMGVHVRRHVCAFRVPSCSVCRMRDTTGDFQLLSIVSVCSVKSNDTAWFLTLKEEDVGCWRNGP